MSSEGRPPIPDTLSETLSPAWLTAALSTVHPGLVVSVVERGPVVSRLTTNARFRIAVEGDLPEGLPEHLCVKGCFSDQGQVPMTVGLKEATFQRDLAATTGVRTPRARDADADPESNASVVIFDDVVAQGGSFLDPLHPYSVDDTANSLEELAKLHARTWMDPDCGSATWLDPWFELLGMARGVAAVESNFDGPIGAGVPEPVRSAQLLVDSFLAVAREASVVDPWCVVHGDPHASNLYRDRLGAPGLVDWQLVQRGPWYLDVGYHIAAALGVADRRAHEQDLMSHYLDRMRGHGVPMPDTASAWDLARRGIVHGFYLWGITMAVEPAVTTELLTRLGTAADDHAAMGVAG